MKVIKEIKRKLFVTTMIMALTFSIILVIIPSIGAENGDMPLSTPDIKIMNITFSDDEPVEDEEITIYTTVLNNGSKIMSNITITFFQDYEDMGNITDITIEAKEFVTVNITWIAEKWGHNISVMISIGNTPLTNTKIGKDIYVDAKPIGNIQSLVLTLIIIFVIYLI